MSYSTIHNLDPAKNYKIFLDGDLYLEGVSALHVESVIYQLESEGVNVVDEVWDEELMQVDLVTSEVLDDDEEFDDDEEDDYFQDDFEEEEDFEEE